MMTAAKILFAAFAELKKIVDELPVEPDDRVALLEHLLSTYQQDDQTENGDNSAERPAMASAETVPKGTVANFVAAALASGREDSPSDLKRKFYNKFPNASVKSFMAGLTTMIRNGSVVKTKSGNVILGVERKWTTKKR